MMRREVAHLTGEEEFFHRRDAELIGKLKTDAETAERKLRAAEAPIRRLRDPEQQRRRIAEVLGIADPRIAADLQGLGYTCDAVAALYLTPLVQVAWADGAVSRKERDLVLSFARLNGVEPETPGYNQVLSWLDRRPSPRFLLRSWTNLLAVLHSIPQEDRNARAEALSRECRSIASASGSILNRICPAERKVLDQIEQDLAPLASKAARAQ